MAWQLLERLHSWKPLARNVVVTLVRIATGAVATASPENEMLIKCLGGAAEASADQYFDTLAPAQQQAVSERLVALLDEHASLICELERGIADQNASVDELTVLIREMLDRRQDLRVAFQRFAAGLAEITQALRRIEAEIQALRREIQGELRDIHRRFDELGRKPRSPYWLSIHDEADVVWLQRLYAESRAWSADRRRALRPEQFAGLLIEANQPHQASALCGDAVALCHKPSEQAGLLLQKMRADLERDRFDEALAALREAVRLAPGRSPFPAYQFEAEQILGVGGAGTALLCRNRFEADAPVVVKCLHADGLERQPDELFREVPVLRRLAERQRDAVVPVHSCGFTDPAGRRGPYIVMDYFPGESLQRYLDRAAQGLPLADFLAVSLPVAQALHAAHGLGIFHRDVKPDNVLVQRTALGWDVRLIDFGLAVKCEVARSSQRAPHKSLQGVAAAGTADFAAPEQMGARKEPIGAWSDVYGFGRFCCYALFRTTKVLPGHWRQLPGSLCGLLERCLQEDPAKRYRSFEPILTLLQELHNRPARRPAVPPAVQKAAPVSLPSTPPPETPPPDVQIEMDILLPGKLYSRLDGVGNEADWQEVGDLPDSVRILDGQAYRLKAASEVSDEQLAHLALLKECSALEAIDLGGCEQITDDGLAHIKGLTALQSLSLEGCCEITDATLVRLKGLSALQALDLSGCYQITDEGLEHLKGIKTLQLLNLARCELITDIGLAHFKGHTGLQSLSLEGCAEITDEGLTALKGLTALRTLNLGQCHQITDVGLMPLKGLPALQHLSQQACYQITPAGLARLKGLSALQSLNFTGCKALTSAGLAHLTGLTDLQSLTLESCRQLTDEGLAHLGRLTSLQSLSLKRCKQLTDAGLTHLRSLLALQVLDLSYCNKVTEAGVAELRKMLPHCDIRKAVSWFSKLFGG
jgi:serine/threonine protein kinase